MNYQMEGSEGSFLLLRARMRNAPELVEEVLASIVPGMTDVAELVGHAEAVQ